MIVHFDRAKQSFILTFFYHPGVLTKSEGRVKCPPLTCLQEHLELLGWLHAESDILQK